VLLPRPATVRRLRLVPSRHAARRPTSVRVSVDQEPARAPVAVAADGTVPLATPLRGRRISIEIVEARFPSGMPERDKQARAVAIAEVQGIPGARARHAFASDALRGRCGDARLYASGELVTLRAVGEVRDLDEHGAVRAEMCGEPRPLRAGEQEVLGEGAVLRIDHLRMQSGPEPDVEPLTHGRVADPGDPGRGERKGVQLVVREPSYLVLGESYNRGWRAECDGEDLGEPEPMQGYANAWRVEPGCRNAAFAFAPNRPLPAAYVLSLLACLALVALLVLAPRRRPRHASRPQHGITETTPRRWPLKKALAAGAAAAVVLGFVFAIRAGVLMGPAVAFILWRGIGAKRLALAGGALLLTVVPILYLAVPVDDPGGYNTNLAVERIAAHWVGVAAIFLVGAALARQLTDARRASGYGPPGGSA
jgi:hypothetical protein